ncbi:MAG: hypothetical protein M1831_001705 [Alyxoria varia]|nr:MAG: hypothetical protein M1831_001705 [Alyxoria varia]
MASKYQDYLAAKVLSEGNVVSYRQLTRALKVHSNVAKQMLYEFHRSQNARKPGCVHATYLISGVSKPQQAGQDKKPNGVHFQQDEDTMMNDDSLMSSGVPDAGAEEQYMSEKISVMSVTLVQEHHLEEARFSFDSISCIHVYSLEPGPLQNIQILSDCNHKVNAEHGSEDLLETWKEYGTIHNPYAQRRTRRQPTMAPAPSASTSAMKPAQKQDSAVAPPAANKAQSAATKPANSTRRPSSSSGQKPVTKPDAKPQAKREVSGGSLFKSFAKTKAPEPEKSEHSASASQASGSAPTPAQDEDEAMPDAPGSSEGESEDPEDAKFALDSKARTKDVDGKLEEEKKAKREREEKMRIMMEEDDGEEHDKPADEASPSSRHEASEENADEEMKDSPPASNAAAEEDEVEAAPTDEKPRRRRGRRRVTRKKTTKDAEGYLVTRQESGWESFSETEPETAAPAPSKKPTVTLGESKKGTQPQQKSQQSQAKKGQGNIMNFFGKK